MALRKSSKYLCELVFTQVEFLQPDPFVDRSTQVQSSDTVLTENQLSEVVGRPNSRARQNSDVIGSHVQRPQAVQVKAKTIVSVSYEGKILLIVQQIVIKG